MSKRMEWQPVESVFRDEMSLYADELAVTIGDGQVAMATFQWPQEKMYAVCHSVEAAPVVPDAVREAIRVVLGSAEHRHDLGDEPAEFEIVRAWLDQQGFRLA